MNEVFKQIRGLIAENKFDELQNIDILRPSDFNWVRDVFESINVAELPAQPALIWTNGVAVDTYTFGQLSKATNKLLNFLRKHGVVQQDVMLLQMALLPHNWLAVLAGIKGGYRLIPAATILGVQDIVYRFGRLMPKVVICDSENAEKIEEAEKLSGKSVHLKILVDGTRENWADFSEIEKESSRAESANTQADDPLFMYFTSGTTGMPKIVIHSHLSYPFGHLTTASWIGLRTGDIHYNISQPGWAKFVWSSFFAPWNMGATIFAFHPNGRFNAKEQLRIIEKYKITTFCAPPTVLRMLIQEDLTQYKLSIRECVAAGEPLNPEIIETWKNGTGLTFRDGYGQTESTCLVANMIGKKIKFGSMGLPTFLYDVVIADDNGNILPPNEEGSICVKTTTNKPNGIFKEYFEDEDRFRAVFKNGLYYTGDKAYKDEEGYVWFVGRDDDVIKSSDYRVGPFEVESVLLEHEAIAESAVVGSPHSVKGFEIKAFVILSEGYSPSQQLADDIFAFSRKNLAPYKMPRIIEFVDELPKTISGKIRRVELRANEANNRAKQLKVDNEFFYTKP